jgi:hypothetical protein
MHGTAVEHLAGEPTEAELDAIKARWIGWGYDVVSVRVIADARLTSRIGPAALNRRLTGGPPLDP